MNSRLNSPASCLLLLIFGCAVLIAVFSRCHAKMLFEQLAKVALGGKTKVIGNVDIGVRGIHQHAFCQLQLFIYDKSREGNAQCHLAMGTPVTKGKGCRGLFERKRRKIETKA